MANLDFNAVFLLIAAGICAILDEVSLENPPPAPPWAMYHKESPNLDFGIRMKYDSTTDKTMTVVISYDTLTTSATTFFQNPQLSDWINGFTGCNVVNFKFNPCTVSRFHEGQLVCASPQQCNYDQFHGCIATAFEPHPDLMAKFLICFFSGKTAVECGVANGLIQDDIEICVNSGRGAQSCNHYHTLFSDSISKRMQTEGAKTGEMPNAITDFKTTTCWVLAQGNLHCPPLCSPPSP